MSSARHHAEWLSLLEISGPFLSLPVLLRAFPQGLDAHDPDTSRDLRLAYEEWLDNQQALTKSPFRGKPDPAIHTAWVNYVLKRALEFDPDTLVEGQVIPPTLKATIAEQGETLRPDRVVLGRDKSHLLIQVYPSTQNLEKPAADKRWKASPATRMMELLRATDVRLGLVTNGEQWMLVVAPKGDTTSFISWYAGLWFDEPLTLCAFRTLLGTRRFFAVPDDEMLETLLTESTNDQQEVTDQLGYQVRRAVEVLVQAIDRADQDRSRQLLAGISETVLYEAALTVMMRLVFLFSAEERGLLLLGDPLYDTNYAVSTLRAQLREAADQFGEEVLAYRRDAWPRLLATFRAVHGGIQHEAMKLMAYGGSLFDPDRFPFLEGRLPSPETVGEPVEPPSQGLPINNRVVLHLLEALQILRVKVPGGGPAEARRLSFRALDVEQIGHVYEGLLDHTAKRAPEPVLGLTGTKNQEPEIALSDLEAQFKKGAEPFVAYLKEQTGRSIAALQKGLQAQGRKLDDERSALDRLRAASNNDEALFKRLRPFTYLIRDDDFDLPAVIPAGSVYVTAGTDRRSTGTHYTPKSLTEPIVQHTLEPLVFIGPAEGLPKDQWQLKPPADLLQLKICDMAMGSGAFLVQTCRWLSERLVEAWESVEQWGSPVVELSGSQIAQSSKSPTAEETTRLSDYKTTRLRITPEGQLSSGDPNEQLIPLDPDERLAFARRIVADRCLYGVDKNPLAVEMAKLSLWLITLDKQRPFTFLNHALKCGDSLVGADEDIFLRWAHGLKSSTMTLFDAELRQQIETANDKRRLLESFEVRDVRDAARKQALLEEADTAIARVKLGCNLIIGTRLLDLKPKDKEARLNTLLLSYMAGESMDGPEVQQALTAARNVKAFHWPFEFPEVFAKERGGFSAFISNPPFIGGRYISGEMGNEYLDYIKSMIANDIKGNADLIAYFYLKANSLICPDGTTGFVGTKTIAEGDTHDVGLAQLVKHSDIYMASTPQTWPGTASVVYVSFHWTPGKWMGKKLIDQSEVVSISSRLTSVSIEKPLALQQLIMPYQGSYVHGMGFLLTDDEKKHIADNDPVSLSVIWPCLSAEDFNSSPTQQASRSVIYFGELSEIEAKKYRGAWKHLLEHVKPEREALNDRVLSKYWWRYKRATKPLYDAIWQLDKVLVCPVVTKHLSFAWIDSKVILLNRMYAFIGSNLNHFSILQSSIYSFWAWQWSGKMAERLQFAPTDCFDNFPIPVSSDSYLHSLGETYHEHRRQIMLARQEGLTKIYNHFHDPNEKAPDIARLRDLHVQMDKAVAQAYSWDDLDLGHGFHDTAQGLRFTLSEPARREVLARLLKLNHERWAAEQKAAESDKPEGGAKKKGKGRKKSGEPMPEDGGGQLGLV